MTLHDQQQAAADVQGMIEAAQRHSGGMSQVEVAEQYRAIQARPIASPVIPQPIPAEAEPDPINFAPIVGAVAKLAAGNRYFSNRMENGCRRNRYDFRFHRGKYHICRRGCRRRCCIVWFVCGKIKRRQFVGKSDILKPSERWRYAQPLLPV
jgi:hypothetical protein